MKKIFFILFALLFLLLPLSEARSKDETRDNFPIEIYVPNTNVIYEYPEIRIVGLIHDLSITQVNILVNDLSERSVNVLKGTFLGTLTLNEGMNEIKVSEKDKDIGTVTIKVFYKKKTTVVPDLIQKDFKRFYGHKPFKGFAEKCNDCHDLSDSKGIYPGKLFRGNISCVNPEEGCHTDKSVNAYDYSHGPVGEEACVGCHNPHGTFNKFSLVVTGFPLCFRCHKEKEKDLAKQYVHSPFEEGDCNVCHDPHGGSQEYQLRGLGAELCYMCHKRDKANMKFVHGPVAAGDCNSCHNPHASANKFQLKEPLEDLCYVCHRYMERNMKKEFVHKPVKDRKCGDCHDPHTSDFKYQLMEEGSNLCYMCHKEKKAQFAGYKNNHPPVSEGQCSKCHDAHFSEVEFLLLKEGEKLCYMCHKDEEYVFNKPYKHGPVKQGDCVACHSSHGSPYERLLIKDFPKPFYTPFEESKYDLCFDECHIKEIVLNAFNSKFTDFRNGNKNLHFTHINKKKGRSCRACHEVHVTTQEKLMRMERPIVGAWHYKVEFTKTPTGGKCIVGCHKPRDYDREKPVPEENWY